MAESLSPNPDAAGGLGHATKPGSSTRAESRSKEEVARRRREEDVLQRKAEIEVGERYRPLGALCRWCDRRVRNAQSRVQYLVLALGPN